MGWVDNILHHTVVCSGAVAGICHLANSPSLDKIKRISIGIALVGTTLYGVKNSIHFGPIDSADEGVKKTLAMYLAIHIGIILQKCQAYLQWQRQLLLLGHLVVHQSQLRFRLHLLQQSKQLAYLEDTCILKAF